VPQGIQRIDTRSTHGWQVRFQGTKMFSDHSSDGSGAKESLAAATKELLRRIATMPAPVTLQRGPSRNKGSDLPPGISGPIVRSRSGSVVRTCHFSILLPRFGEAPVRKSIYIGNENTYNTDKYQVALNKAIEMRRAAEEAYRVAATRARRKAGRELKAKLRA
jgi:hypothetical protein